MKGLILSGGAGTRLRPITHTSAKQLVPIANKPILFYGIEDMAAAGITEIGIIIAPSTGDEIREAVGDGSQFGVEVTWIPQDEPLGLAHCVLIAHDFLGDDDFVMYLGDNMLEQGLTEFVQRFEADRSAADTPQLGSDYVYGSGFVLGNSGDEIILTCGASEIAQVPMLSAFGFPSAPRGASLALLRDHLDESDNDDGANWCESTTDYNGDFGTPGSPNEFQNACP